MSSCAVVLPIPDSILIADGARLVHPAAIVAAVSAPVIATIAPVIATIAVVATVIAVVSVIVAVRPVVAVVPAVVVVAIVMGAAPFFLAFLPLTFLALLPIFILISPPVTIVITIAILRTRLHHAGSAPCNGESHSPEQTFTEEFHLSPSLHFRAAAFRMALAQHSRPSWGVFASWKHGCRDGSCAERGPNSEYSTIACKRVSRAVLTPKAAQLDPAISTPQQSNNSSLHP